MKKSIIAVITLLLSASYAFASTTKNYTFADLGLTDEFFANLSVTIPLTYIDTEVHPTPGSTIGIRMWQQSVTAPMNYSTIYVDPSDGTEFFHALPGWCLSISATGIDISSMRLNIARGSSTGISADFGRITYAPRYVRIDAEDTPLDAVTIVYDPLTASSDGFYMSHISFVFDESTGVEAPVADNESDEWVDLYGRRLSDRPTLPGFYIHNRRAVLVR